MSMSVRPSVCLSVCSHNSKTTQPNFAKVFVHVASRHARSSPGGVVIRYVLPVLWITSCFHIKVLWRVMCIPNGRDSNQILLSDIDKQVHKQVLVVNGAPGAKFGMYRMPCHRWILIRDTQKTRTATGIAETPQNRQQSMLIQPKIANDEKSKREGEGKEGKIR